MVTSKCDYRRNYISQYEELKFEDCDADADWTWYEGGRRVGMCHQHIGHAWLFASYRNGGARPVTRITQNPAAFGSQKSKVIKPKV
jgi:hypothetical protein